MAINSENIRRVNMTRDQLFEFIELIEKEDMPNDAAVDLHNSFDEALDAAHKFKNEQYVLIKVAD